MRKYFMMLAAAATVASCTQTEVINSPVDAEDVLIQAKPVHELVNGTVTRAPFIGNISGTNHLEARVVTYNNSDAVHTDGNMVFSATSSATAYDIQSLTEGDGKFGITGTDAFTLFGMYPATGWTVAVGTDLTDHEYSATFDGTQDLMITGTATTNPNDSEAGTYPTLTFKHQLTKIEIKVKAKDADAAAVWTEFESIELTGLHGVTANAFNTSFTYKPIDGTISFGTPASTMSFYEIDNSQLVEPNAIYTSNVFTGKTVEIEEADAAGSNILPVAYSMIAPFVSVGDKDLTFAISAKYDDGQGGGPASTPKTVSVSIPMVPPAPVAPVPPTANTAGYAYSITLTFADTGLIIATAEVIDWIDGGDLEEVIM